MRPSLSSIGTRQNPKRHIIASPIRHLTRPRLHFLPLLRTMSEKQHTDTEDSRTEISAPAHGSVDHILDPELAAALSAGPRLSATSRTALRLYLVLTVAFMGSLSFGFDTSVIGSVNGLIQFIHYFGLQGGASGGGQGIVAGVLISMFSLGCIPALAVAAPIADRFGRRAGMVDGSPPSMIVGSSLALQFCASVVILTGVAVVTSAQNITSLLVGRFLVGFGSTISHAAAPAYVAEMSPPQVSAALQYLSLLTGSQWRGRLAGISNAFTFIGTMTSSGLVIGTGRLRSSLSWRLPLAVQFIPSLVILFGSPRWLMSAGRADEARRVLARYHAADGDENAPVVLLEFQELQEHIKPEAKKRLWDYSSLFNSRGSRYRMLITLWLGLCCLLSGPGIFYFSTVALHLAGVNTQNERLVLSFTASAIGAAGALIGAILADKIGRRTLWLWGSAVCAAALVLTGGGRLVFRRKSTDLSQSKGLVLFAAIQSAGALCNTFGGSIAYKNIGWRYFLVPATFDVVQTLVVWLFAVETKGRTLEELDVIFQERNPVAASINKRRETSEKN
ncbi:unnamed protein product [Mycena citricolor]|uniref:Major facilitator superfamily (MFS) profile domain-containing protein n=1 Tax=Mycena citricolor TaxID=2018698 RepID=A0AAD2GS30_9AGAR|nr:unnamed protein product [Mycena citricolor]